MRRADAGAVGGLSFAFAVFLAMLVVLTGRLQAAGLTLALAVGALGVGIIVAGRPLDAVRGMTPRDRLTAAGGGLCAFFAAPAVIAAVRLSDAPAGSVVVFWMAGGWAALAGLVAVFVRLRARARAGALLALAGAVASVAGAAAVVANWERPSSFSPLVRFPVQEVAILAAGALFVGGGLIIARSGRRGRLGGAVVCGGVAATLAAAAWALVAGPAAAWATIAELPVQVAIAAVAWGAVCAFLPRVLARSGTAHAAASLAAAPVIISALTWVEQATGVMGPQPFALGGLMAGVVLTVAAAAVLVAPGAPEGAAPRGMWARLLAVVPLALAVVALALPAIAVAVTVTGSPAGTFSGSWLLPGAESVAVWGALALALVLAGAASAGTDPVVPFVGLAACAAWPMLLDVPTHVLNPWLAPGIQSYYGTEYGSIVFTHVINAPLLASVTLAGIGFAALLVAGLVRRRSHEGGPGTNALNGGRKSA